MLRRTLSPCSKEVKAQAYKSLVRPQLEYGVEAWNPYEVTSINRLEQVQRAAARFVYQDYRRASPVTALLSKLNWDLLHTRRLLAQATMFYKIQHNLVNISFPAIIIPATYIGRNDHLLKYSVPEATIDPYKYSFFPRTTKLWNRLPNTYY